MGGLVGFRARGGALFVAVMGCLQMAQIGGWGSSRTEGLLTAVWDFTGCGHLTTFAALGRLRPGGCRWRSRSTGGGWLGDEGFVGCGGVAFAHVGEGAGDSSGLDAEMGGGLALREAFGEQGENSALARGGIARGLVDDESIRGQQTGRSLILRHPCGEVAQVQVSLRDTVVSWVARSRQWNWRAIISGPSGGRWAGVRATFRVDSWGLPKVCSGGDFPWYIQPSKSPPLRLRSGQTLNVSKPRDV